MAAGNGYSRGHGGDHLVEKGVVMAASWSGAMGVPPPKEAKERLGYGGVGMIPSRKCEQDVSRGRQQFLWKRGNGSSRRGGVDIPLS